MPMTARAWSVVAALYFCSGMPLHAQTGSGSEDCSVGPGIVCEMLVTSDDRGEVPRRWATVLILWKGASHRAELRPTTDTAAAKALYRRFIEAGRAIEDAGRVVMGGASGDRYWMASHTMWHRGPVPDSLFVLDQAFEIPARDSAIVVLVDGVETMTHTPRIVGAATIASRMEPVPPDKRWVSGDTTFWVRSRPKDGGVPASILSHPLVKAYLSGAP